MPGTHRSETSGSIAAQPAATSSLVRDYLELAKPEITFLVVITALAGFLLGSPGSIDWFKLIITCVGVALTSGGAAMLNHVIEAEWDGQMKRTAHRPIPTERVSKSAARNTGFLLGAAGIGLICPLVNPLTAILAGVAFVMYVYVYTPMKRRTDWNTLVGTIPGSLPALGGWTAATGNLHAGGWAIFLILVAWQMPHFLSLAWMYRKDYTRGGFDMVSVGDPDGVRTSRQALLYTIALLIVSVLPFVLGDAGLVYLVGALALGFWFLGHTIRFRMRRTGTMARSVLKASVYYIPALVALIVVDRFI